MPVWAAAINLRAVLNWRRLIWFELPTIPLKSKIFNDAKRVLCYVPAKTDGFQVTCFKLSDGKLAVLNSSVALFAFTLPLLSASQQMNRSPK
jgi:hypothetical protein